MNKAMRNIKLSALIVLLFSTAAVADDEHYVNTLIGDRATEIIHVGQAVPDGLHVPEEDDGVRDAQ